MENPVTFHPDPLDLLADLVRALDKTNWSSWQTTAPFAKELDRARDYLDNL